MSIEKNDQYYPLFDYLRIVLAIVVAAAHAGLFTWEHAGSLAVQIFFALSGWLIGGILLNSKRSSLPRFYYNRAARIWIPYFVALAILLTASALKDPITAKWTEIAFYKITFVYDLFGTTQLANYVAAMPLAGTGNHFWSISSEEKFYLFTPLVILMIPFGRSIWFWSILAICTLASPYWLYFSAITFGVIAAIAREKYGDWHLRGHNPVLFAFVAATLSIAATFSSGMPYRVAAPFIGISIVLLLARAGKPSSIGRFLGGVSYPMYLNHWIGLLAINAVTKRFPLPVGLISQIISILVGLAVSTVLYLLIDAQVAKYRDRCFTPSRGYVLAAIGFSLVVFGAFAALTIYRAPVA